MDFSEYLESKKISETRFRDGDPDTYREFNRLFGEMHPKSFTLQKLFLINSIRRQYPLPAGTEKTRDRQESRKPVIPRRTSASPAGENAPGQATRPKPVMPKKKTTPPGGAQAKPVMKPKIKPAGKETEEAGEQGKKPARPVMKPRIPGKPADTGKPESSERPKPVMKPKMKPRIKPKITPENKPADDTSSGPAEEKNKAVRPRPVIKPRIPGRTSGTEEKPEAKSAPEIKPGDPDKPEAGSEKGSGAMPKKNKPIIKPRNKKE